MKMNSLLYLYTFVEEEIYHLRVLHYFRFVKEKRKITYSEIVTFSVRGKNSLKSVLFLHGGELLH